MSWRLFFTLASCLVEFLRKFVHLGSFVSMVSASQEWKLILFELCDGLKFLVMTDSRSWM